MQSKLLCFACLAVLGPAVWGCGGDDHGSDGGATTADPDGGTGAIHGSVASRAFDHVAASWFIGAPDDPQHTRVIYVFDALVACAEIAKPGWDQTVADGSQVVEMKLIGTQAGDYPVAADGHPATGEASVNYTLTSRTATPQETSAKSGHVTLDHIKDKATAGGSFDLVLPGGNVTGTFHAAYCAAGHEP